MHFLLQFLLFAVAATAKAGLIPTAPLAHSGSIVIAAPAPVAVAHAPVAVAHAPVATSYANSNSISLGAVPVIAKPAHVAVAHAAPILTAPAYGLSFAHGVH